MKKFEFISTPLWTIVGRAGGLIVPFFIALWFGASPETDAFFLSYGLIISLNGIFNPVFESLLVPYFAQRKNKSGSVAGLSNAIVLSALPVMLGFFAVVGIFLPIVLKNWSGLDDSSSQLTARFFFEMLPLFLFGVLIAASNGIFYTHKVFWFPAFSPSVRFLAVLILLFAAHQSWGIHAATLGYGVGEILRWIGGITFLWRKSLWDFSVTWDQSGKESGDFFANTLFQILALFALNLIPLANQWFASWFGAGKLSLLSYADRLFQIPYQLFMTGMLQIFLSYWSDNYHAEGAEVFRRKVQRHIATVAKMALAFSLLLFFLREPVVRIVFGLSRMPEGELDVITNLFGWLILGFLPSILNLLYVRVLFVMKKTAVFCLQSWGRLLLNVLFNYVLIRMTGFEGIAISTGVVAVVTTAALYFYLRRYWKEKGAVAP